MRNFDNWAKVYDLVYGEQKNDIAFYKAEAKKAKGKVLEAACGTGRVYLELLKAGVDAYGFDVSAEMLKALKKKAKELNLEPKVFKADMRHLKTRKRFALILIPFRAFLHNLTTEDQIDALKSFRKHLAPKGKLVLNFFFPKPEVVLKEFGKEIKKTIRVKQGKLAITKKSYFADETNQVVEFTHTLTKANKTIFKEKFRIAFIYKREFELLLRLAGFKKWKVYGGFKHQPLKSHKQEMVWIIKK